MNEVKAGNTYEHYSGKKYKILAISRHSENPEEFLVVYQGLYNCEKFGPNPIWARPLPMFAENVIINGKETPRFKLI